MATHARADVAQDETYLMIGQATPDVSVEIKRVGDQPIVPAEFLEGHNVGVTGQYLPPGDNPLVDQDGLLAGVIGIIRAGIATSHQDQAGAGFKRARGRSMSDVFNRVSRDQVVLPHYLQSSPL